MKKFFILILFYFFAANSYTLAKDLKFVQVTDVRFSSQSQKEYLTQFVNEVNEEKDIKFVIFTGDNISKPNENDLIMFLKTVKKLKKPVYIALGDKDVNKGKNLSKKQYMQIVSKQLRNRKMKTPNYMFKNEGVIFIVADGSRDVVPGSVGYYKDKVLEWIDANLDVYKKKNVIIFQHFPLIPPTDKETYFTFKPEKYLEILNNHKNVKAVVSGHFGVNKEVNKDGIIHISTSSLPNYRVIDIIDYETSTPTIWAEVKNLEH